MARRTTQLLAELRTLAGQASENLYRRVELAAAVMADLDWIASTHGGSDIQAQEALRDEYFADLGGYVTLGKLLAMHAKLPRSTWEELRWNVAAIEAAYDEAAEAGREKVERTSWKSVADEQRKRADKLDSDLSGTRELVDMQRGELEQLRAKLRELTLENERLKGRIDQLERTRAAA